MLRETVGLHEHSVHRTWPTAKVHYIYKDRSTPVVELVGSFTNYGVFSTPSIHFRFSQRKASKYSGGYFKFSLFFVVNS